MTTNQTFNPTTAILNRGDWRRRLAADYRAESERLDTAYRRTLARLEPEVRQFDAALTQLNEDGTPITSRDMRRMGEYKRLLNAVRTEMNDFAKALQGSSETLSENAIDIGTDAALQMALAAADEFAPRLTVSWVKPTPETLRKLINYADEAARLGKFDQFGANAAENLGDVLIAFTALGKGSGAISSVLDAWFNVPRSWGENMTRTMQAWSYRRSAHENYRANPNIVIGWVWWATLGSPRTCPACLGMHGSFHTPDEELNGHHRCRCTPLPVIRGSTWHLEVESGEDWLRRQEESFQKQILGKGGLELWLKGTPLEKFIHEHEDDLYGKMIRRATLKEIKGGG